VGYNLFQKRGKPDAPVTEFAATVLSLPPGAESQPPALESLPSGIDSGSPPTDQPSDLGSDSLPAPAADALVEQRPTVSHIGRYALKGLLAQGGLGQVYEAWDPMLSRTVAVKTLQFNLDTPSRVALDGLFLNEARAAAGLSHPNIVTVFDAGLSAHGVYIAMERLHGRDLRQRLAEGWAPTPGQAAQVVSRVADALAYAHANGVVHCDIKPGNIFLGKRDKPKVLDFGIARVAHGKALPALEGAVAGSPHYLAPEQLNGGTLDARTDIHALGVVFYEMLTLRKAFTGDSLEQITTAVLTNHPAPAHELRPGVPRTLSAIAAKAMAREPAERYANAGEMAQELRRWIERHSSHELAGAATTSPDPGHTRPVRKRGGIGTPVWAVAALAAAVLLGLVWVARRPSNVSAPPVAAAPGPAPAALPAATPEARLPAVEAASAAPAAAVASPPPQTAPRAAAPPRVPKTSPAPARDARVTAAAPAVVATGQLQLAISPWGQVEVDGTAAGITPPLTKLTLSEGAHTVTVRNEDFPPYTTTVQVSADKPVTVRHRFGQ
jgi:serine/threonine-protein kinase